MKIRLIYFAVVTLTIAQVIACLSLLGLVGLIAGSTPFHGLGAATWDGWLPAIPGGRWFLFAGIAIALLGGATYLKKALRRLQLSLVMRGE